MKSKLFITFFLLLSFQLPAQKPGNSIAISGNLIDKESREPVPYASISLIRPDSTLYTGTVTDIQGSFELAAKEKENYILKVQFIGYQTVHKPLTISEGKKINLGTLYLVEDSRQLQELVVEGEKQAMSLSLDKKVYEVDKNALAQSGSATDILDNLPSVTVSASGAISLRGNSNVHVLINGRRSGLTLNNALDQIPADNIEKSRSDHQPFCTLRCYRLCRYYQYHSKEK